MATIGVALVVCTAAAVSIAGEPPAAAPTSAATAPDVDIAALIHNLGSSDFEAREAAQRQLESVGWQHRAMLAKLVETQSDAEVKARLQARLLQIDEQLAVDPPPIALHLKNASINQVAAAFGEQLGGLNVVFSPGADSLTPVTLDMEAPFWDVCAALANQGVGRTAISRIGGDNRALLSIGALRAYDRQMGFAAVPLLLQYTQRFDAQAAPTADPLISRLAFQMTIVSDPHESDIRRAVATDLGGGRSGEQFAQGDRPRRGRDGRCRPGHANGWTTSLNLALPAQLRKGKKIVSIKGEGRLEVQVTGNAYREVADLEKHVNQPIDLGTQTINILQLEPRNGALSMNVQVRSNDPQHSTSVNLSLEDQNGLTIWTGAVGGSVGTLIGGQPQGPFKLVINAGGSHQNRDRSF